MGDTSAAQTPEKSPIHRNADFTKCTICSSADSVWFVCVAVCLLPVIYIQLSLGWVCPDCVCALHSQSGK